MVRSSVSVMLFAVALWLSVEPVHVSAQLAGLPVRFLASCEIDLDADRRLDLVLSLQTVRGYETIALMAHEPGYTAHVLSVGQDKLGLECRFGRTVKETTVGGGKGRIVETPGTYVVVNQPEGASAAYVWSKGSFLQVWLSD